MKAILGLGNPGLRYRLSRHNLGFLVVETLARANRIKIKQRAFNCLLGKGTIENQEVLLGLPSTFMNLSGEAACAIARHERLDPKALLIVCDDVNLPLGKMRIRPKGSDGGHKGLRSIIEALGSEDFARLRIGVERPGQGALSAHVLGRFNKKENKIINETIEKAVRAIEVWLKAGIQAAMDQFN